MVAIEIDTKQKVFVEILCRGIESDGRPYILYKNVIENKIYSEEDIVLLSPKNYL